MVLRNVSAGTHAVSVDYAGTDKYTADSAVADDLVVSKIITEVTVVPSATAVYAGENNVTFTVTLKDNDNNNLTAL